MQKKKVTAVQPRDIPAVVDFLDAQQAIQDFKEEHAEVFSQLDALVEGYNAKLEAAEKTVRDKEVTCGPFTLKHFATKYDALALYNAVGRDRFLELGGKIGTETTYDVDKGRLDANIANNKLAPETIEVVRKETPNFHVPKKLVVP